MQVWTDDRVELLTSMWGRGYSGTQIAVELGGVTRNAVVGKVHRLGLSNRIRENCAPPRPPRARAAPSLQHRKIRQRPLDIVLAAPEPEIIEHLIPLRQRCALLDLTDSKCRWPIGDPGTPEFFFCGGAPVDGMPYCNYHSRVAYKPSSDRRAA